MSWTRVRISTSPAPFLSVINFQLPPHLFLSTFFPSGFRGSFNCATDAPPTKSLVISKIKSNALTFSARHHPAQSTVLLLFFLHFAQINSSWEENTFTALNFCHITGFHCAVAALIWSSHPDILCFVLLRKYLFIITFFSGVFCCFHGTHNNNNGFSSLRNSLSYLK